MERDHTQVPAQETAPTVHWSFTFWGLFLSKDPADNSCYELRPLVSLYEELVVFTPWSPDASGDPRIPSHSDGARTS